MCKDKTLGLVWIYGQPRHLSEMAGWTGQQKSPHRLVVPSHSPDSWAQTCLDFLVYINTLPKNIHARTSELRTLPFSAVLPKNVISISREEGVDGGLWWSLCVTSPMQNEICATSLLYIYVLWNISDFLSKLQNTISNATTSDGTVRLVPF